LKPFVVVLVAKPAVRLPKGLAVFELNFQEPSGTKKVQVTKIEEDVSGTLIQTGLRFKVFLDAQNAKDAVNSSKALIDGIISFMTLITGKSMEIPKEEIAYEIRAGVEKREFLQTYYDVPMKQPSRRQIDPQTLINFIDRQLKLEARSLSSAERVARAGRWYRLGTMVTDVFDQFNCFWIGLEALNPLLQQTLQVKDEPVLCPNCKHELPAPPTILGVKTFIQTKIAGGKDLYRDIRRLRNDVMHSTKQLHLLQNQVSIYTPKIGEVLFRAICFLLGFENWETMEHGAILREFPMRGELQGLLTGGDPSSLGINGQDPNFELSHQIKASKMEEDGSVTYVFDTNIKPNINPIVRFNISEIRMYGDSETKGAILKKIIHKADGRDILL
jgi:hypothetical protein